MRSVWLTALALVTTGGLVVAVGATPAAAREAPPSARVMRGFTHPAGHSEPDEFCEPTAKVICPQTNPVWSGYVITPTEDNQFTSVSASWVQPVASCSIAKPTAWTLFWVGLDGWKTNDSPGTVEQGGTSAQCEGDKKNAGHPVYQVWWEMYPTNDVMQGFYVTPGDDISASVVYSSAADTYTITVDDTTSGQSMVVVISTDAAATNPDTYTITQDGVTTGPTPFMMNDSQPADVCGDVDPCENGSAEWVVEAPGGDPDGSVGTLYPLAHYRPVTFTSADAVDSAGDQGHIVDSGIWSTAAVDLTNLSNTYLASVTPLKKQGSQFKDIWDPGQ
jgi:Peptidase A4 family